MCPLGLTETRRLPESHSALFLQDVRLSICFTSMQVRVRAVVNMLAQKDVRYSQQSMPVRVQAYILILLDDCTSAFCAILLTITYQLITAYRYLDVGFLMTTFHKCECQRPGSG